MNDWLHCNKCFVKFGPEVKLYLVECAHVFCENCIKLVRTSKCLVCGKSDSFILIDNDMHTSAQQFFIPSENHLKKIIEITTKMIEVQNFQSMHRQRLFQNQTQKYQFLKREMFNYHQKMKGFISENRMLRSMLASNTRQEYPTPGRFASSTPSPNTGENMSFDNRSVLSSVPPCTPTLPSRSVPGFAHRVPQYDRNSRGMPIPHNQPHLFNGTGYRPSPSMMGPPGNRKNNMASIHKPPSTTSSMNQLHGKRT